MNAFFVLGAIYAIVILLAFSFQSKLIFYPGVLAKDFKFLLGAGDRELFLKTMDNETINALFYNAPAKRVVLYFHGNAGDLSGWQGVAADFIAAGYAVLIPDYRGYGKSTGSISERGLYEDAETCWRYLTSEAGFRPEDIVIYGRSIGSGVAVELAMRHPSAGLILESPYSDFKMLAREKVPYLLPGLWLRFSFDNVSKINHVKAPVIFIHGKEDELIPVHHSQKLYEVFSGKKKVIIIEGAGHNNVGDFHEYHDVLHQDMQSFF